MPLTSKQILQELRQVKGREIGVVGAGRSGLAAAKLALSLGADVRIFDERGADELAIQQLKALAQTHDLRCLVQIEAFSVESLAAVDLLVVSPGVPLQQPVLQQLQAQGQLLVSEVDLALAQLSIPLIAITGTNGKSTVTTMISDILRASGLHPFSGGNLGVPLSSAVVDAQDYDVLVLELSSYQLELCRLVQAEVAVITNLAPDHLNRYADLDAYYDAKRNIYRQMGAQACLILRAQDLDDGLFADAPSSALCTYAELSDDEDFSSEHKLYIKGQRIFLRPELTAMHAEEPGEWFEIDIDNPHVMGAHNMQNIAVAILAAQAMGVEPKNLASAISAYQGIAHRLQRVQELDEILYVNDSKATNVDATVKALHAFARPIHLIAGGLAKGDDLNLIAQAAKGRVHSLVCIGQAADDMDAALNKAVDIREHAETMSQAVQQATAHAQAGDVVLLSPACASFDQFANFEKRGEAFVQAVHALNREDA